MLLMLLKLNIVLDYPLSKRIDLINTKSYVEVFGEMLVYECPFHLYIHDVVCYIYK